MQAVDRVHIIQKNRPQSFSADHGAVKIGLLVLAVLRAAQDYVTLVGGQEDQFMLAVKSTKNGVDLPFSLAYLDHDHFDEP